jgi:pimeloyl-ACP methyl ester carboxylesterase
MNFVLVHGATAGGWLWKDVATCLRAAGHHVYTPTLTGLGERKHLLTREVDLYTHIQDIVNVLTYEDLHDVVLVGHSYGGVVIQGVAEQVPHRLKQLIFLDALVLEDGETAMDLYDPAFVAIIIQFIQEHGDGWFYPPQGDDARYSAHPFKTFQQPISLQNPVAAALSRTYIACTNQSQEKGNILGVIRSAARVKAAGWPYHELFSDHEPMKSMPDRLAQLLQEVA